MEVKFLEKDNFSQLINYFLSLSDEDYKRMGMDKSLFLPYEKWILYLENEYEKPLSDKKLCYAGWWLDNQLIGHSTINKIIYGKEAYIHLHLWKKQLCQQGLGSQFFLKSVDFFFRKFKLDTIYCEPNAKNIQSNKTLIKTGFKLYHSYFGKPSDISYEHEINCYQMTKEKFYLEIFN